MKHVIRLLAVSLFAMVLTGCGYNDIQESDEHVKATFSELLNQYQRRNDLIPNLVQVTKGYADHEAGVFKDIAEARAKVGQVKLSTDQLDDPAAVARFEQAQSQMGSALSRLLAVSENYPSLKADTLFQNVQVQLEGTENRIAVARQRYVSSIREYNLLMRQFPTVITAKVMGYRVKAQYEVGDEATLSKAPSVNFGAQPAAQ